MQEHGRPGLTQKPPDSDQAASLADPEKSAGEALTQEALDWFVRLQADAGNPATSRAFRAWLGGEPRRAEAFEKVAGVWGAPEFLQATKNVAKATGFAAPVKKTRRPLAKKAAVVIGALIVAIGIAQLPDLKLWLDADYLTSTGQQQQITLPDGSQMILNTGSAVVLDFSEQQRGVRILKGEAYFDIRPNKALPFRVAGHFGNVEVKGTAFAIKLDGREDRVVLTRGKVEVVRRNRPQDHTSLSPGEATSVTGTSIMPPRKIDTDRSLAWLEGRISFHDQPLGEVLDDLRRYYSGRIFVVNKTIEKVSVSGNYQLDQPLLAVQSLAAAAGVSVTALPGGILILR